MKNLVIHPQDQSTTFLEPIYKQADNKKVVQNGATPNEVENLIKRSERVLMMGHGSPSGLFAISLFDRTKWETPKWMAINSNDKDILTSDQNVYIWCNADQFVEANDLKGFYSGMFISEVGEARYCGVPEANQDMVDESNDAFAKIVGKYINLPVAELYEKVIEEYGVLAEVNPVAKFNHDRLYLR